MIQSIHDGTMKRLLDWLHDGKIPTDLISNPMQISLFLSNRSGYKFSSDKSQEGDDYYIFENNYSRLEINKKTGEVKGKSQI